MNEELRRLVEAILFAAARKIELSEIAKLSKHSEADVLSVLTEWKANLSASPHSATMVIQDGTAWKLTVKEEYLSVIKKVVTKTELPKSILQTLAVVAYKAPVLQSKVIKIRTNKAYDHLRALEESLLITREKHGRSKMIKLTPKFYEYFDVDPRKLREKFSSSGDLEKAIEAKEKEGADLVTDRQKQTEERLEKPKITLHQGVETYDTVEILEKLEPTGVEIFEDKVGELKVYDIPPENMNAEEKAVWDAAHPIHKKKHHKKHHAAHPTEKKSEDEETTTDSTETTNAPEMTPTTETTNTPDTPTAALKDETTTIQQVQPMTVTTQTPAVTPEKKELGPDTTTLPAEKRETMPEAQKTEAPAQKKRKQKAPKAEAPAPTPEEQILAPMPEEPKQLTPEQQVHKEAQEKTAHLKNKDFEKGDGLAVTPEMETEIERKLKRILEGKETKEDDETPPPL